MEIEDALLKSTDGFDDSAFDRFSNEFAIDAARIQLELEKGLDFKGGYLETYGEDK